MAPFFLNATTSREVFCCCCCSFSSDRVIIGLSSRFYRVLRSCLISSTPVVVSIYSELSPAGRRRKSSANFADYRRLFVRVSLGHDFDFVVAARRHEKDEATRTSKENSFSFLFHSFWTASPFKIRRWIRKVARAFLIFFRSLVDDDGPHRRCRVFGRAFYDETVVFFLLFRFFFSAEFLRRRQTTRRHENRRRRRFPRRRHTHRRSSHRSFRIVRVHVDGRVFFFFFLFFFWGGGGGFGPISASPAARARAHKKKITPNPPKKNKT